MATCPTCHVRQPNEALVCPHDGAALLPDEAFSSADRPLEAGQMVGEYRVEGKLGEGGFGEVYGAVHPLIGKTVAIKVLNRQCSSNPEMVARFIAEARAVNQIRHRNIIDIFSFGALPDGRHYYVMELLEGEPFDAYLGRNGRLSPEAALPILRMVARALDGEARPAALPWVVGKGKWSVFTPAGEGALVGWVGHDGKSEAQVLVARLSSEGKPSAQGLRVSDGVMPVKDPLAMAVAGSRVGLTWTEGVSPRVSSKRALLRLLDAACIP